jgi:hypothetical protein
MRIALPHSLGKDEVRTRLQSRLGDASGKASELIGGMAQVETQWIDADHLTMTVSAMGFTIPSQVTLEEARCCSTWKCRQGWALRGA